MTCPVWKDYRDTIEECEEEPTLDGEIYFVIFGVISDKTVLITEGSETGESQGVIDFKFEDDIGISCETNLPSQELGTWRFEFIGDFYPNINYLTIEECVYQNIDGDINSLVIINNWRDTSPGRWANQWGGILTIYFDLFGISYGPLVIEATVPYYDSSW
mgnify:CR=1 FL=1